MSKRNRMSSVYVFGKYNNDYDMIKRSILMSGECITRKATEEELNRFKNK